MLQTQIASAYTSESFSALALAALGLSATIPTLGAALVSGTLADRYDRHWLMRVVAAVTLAASVTLALLLWWSPHTPVGSLGPAGSTIPLWLLLAFPIWATLTAAVTIFRPTFNASVPRLVEVRLLGSANGLLYGATVAASSATSVLCGLLVERDGAATAAWIPVALFAASFLFLVVGPRIEQAPRRRRRFLSEALEGYRYLGQRRELLAVTVGSLAINFLSALAFVELAQYSAFYLGQGPAFLGYLYGVGTLGAGAGVLAINRIPFEHHVGRLLAALTVGMGLCIIGFILTHSAVVALIDMFVFGMLPGMSQIAFLAGVQATVEDSVLGRVFAADEVGSYSFVPVGQYAGGSLTYAAGLETTYVVAGSTMALVGVALLLTPAVARFRFDPATPPPSDPPGSLEDPPSG